MILICAKIPDDEGDGSGMGDCVSDICIDGLSAEELDLAWADAALIAAAPELLGALIALVESDAQGQIHRDRLDTEHIFDAAREAIARATRKLP